MDILEKISKVLNEDVTITEEDKKIYEEIDTILEKKWSAGVETSWHPKEGFFEQSAEKIASGLKRASKDLKQAMSRLNFYINRAGKNLDAKRKKALELAKDKLHKLYGEKKD